MSDWEQLRRENLAVFEFEQREILRWLAARSHAESCECESCVSDETLR